MSRREIEPSRRIVFLDPDAAFSVRMTRNQYWASSERKLEEFFKLKREYPKTEYPYVTMCRAEIKSDAAKQLARYAADRDLARAWHLRPQGTVKLTRLAIVFHGTELALSEEI